MPTLISILRDACVRHDLPTTGNTDKMLQRLLTADDKKDNDKKKAKEDNKKDEPVLEAVLVGERLSAAEYFKVTCGKDMTKAKPKLIIQKNGKTKLKELKVCNDAHGGECVKWVNVKP